MATLHNPTDFDLFCPVLARVVASGETVEVTDEQAAHLVPSPIFEVAGAPATEAPAQPKTNVPAAVASGLPETAAADSGSPAAKPAPVKAAK